MPDETHSMDRMAKSTEAIEALLRGSWWIRVLAIAVLCAILGAVLVFGAIEFLFIRILLR